MFVGRSFELDGLNKLYSKDGFQFAIVHGRKNVGKTSLIKEFCKNRPSLFYIPEEHNEHLALRSFAALINDYFNLAGNTRIDTWENAFNVIYDKSNKRKIIIALDEFLSVTEKNQAIASILYKVIVSRLRYSNLFLILIDSTSYFTENNALSPINNLFSLRTSQFKIEPFDFFDSCLFYKGLSIIDKIKLYSTLGGTPQYIVQFDPKLTYEINVMEFLLKKTCYLYDEPENYLKAEFDDSRMAFYILSLLSRGPFNLDKLSEADVRNPEEYRKTIKKLLSFNLITRSSSVGKSIVRPRSLYRLEDNFFRFWFRFLYKNKNLIDMGMSNFLYQNKIMPELNSHVGYIFEDICIQYLKRKNSMYELPFVFESIGSWLGYNVEKRRPAQIDVVAANHDSILLGECKWNREPISIGILLNLIQKGDLMKYKNKFFALFSKSGFSQELKNYCTDKDNFLLYSLHDIESI